MPETAGDVTRLLTDWRNGDPDALGKLTPLLYHELRGVARRFMQQERPDHTLQPTALLHEAYLRLADRSTPEFLNRSHFFAIAAQVMRQVLVDQARYRRAAKRDGGRKVPLSETMALSAKRNVDVLDLDRALTELAQFDGRKARIVELRFFAGLSMDETATTLDISASTIRREMRMAETWLYQRLKTQPA